MKNNLTDLNQIDLEALVQAIGWVFEHSPWVAAQAWSSRPWESVEALHQAMRKAVEQAPVQMQLDLIRAHPDLGARAKMADASVQEQRGAGLDSLTSAEYQRIQDLNTGYTQKFGFPFIIAVKGKTKQDIFEAMEKRLHHDYQTEFAAALGQIYKIASFRLADSVE